jgi:S1-C subfamily serine protease
MPVLSRTLVVPTSTGCLVGGTGKMNMSEVLTDLSDALAAAVSAAGPSVARVDARNRYPASGIVYAAEGIVVTASHVVRREEGITIGVGEEDIPAELVGRDPTTDIAVLRASTGGLTPARWGDADQLKVGHVTLALGRPGKTVRATMGIASAVGGEWRSPAGGRFERYVLADVAMHPGFSGGPLLGLDGGVLGMNTSGLLRAATPSIPIADVKRIADALLAHGTVSRGYLGITPQPARLSADLAEKLGRETGLLVTSVEPEGPAAKSGLLLGDVIVGFDGASVTHPDDLFGALADAAGRSIVLGIVRGGQAIEVEVEVGERGRR